MKKIFWMTAVALVAGLSFTSCGSDDEENQTPNTPQTDNTKFDVTASVTLDKHLAEYGYMVATYTYKGKSETIELKKGDKSDQFPTTNNFGASVINYVNKQYSINYSNDDFIVRNVVIKDLDKSKNENAVFTIKFVVDPQHPEITEESNRTFVIPDVVGYTEGGLTMVHANFRVAKGIAVSKFEDWLSKREQEFSVTFGPAAANQ